MQRTSQTSKPQISDGPTKAMIEVARACNLRCPACPVGNGRAHSWPMMPLPMYQEIIAKNSGIEKVIMHTNGLLLSEEVGERLIDAGLDRLTISIDAVEPHAYAKYRVGGDFATLLDNIRTFMLSRQRRRSALPEVEGQFIVMSSNEHQIGRFPDLCRELGIDVVSIKTFNERMDLTGSHEYSLLKPTNPEYSRSQGNTYEVPVTRDRQMCSWPTDVLVVNADGTVVPCGYDYNNWVPLGSFSPGLQRGSWWRTRRRGEFVAQLQQNAYSIDLCQKCPQGVISLSKTRLQSTQTKTEIQHDQKGL